MMVLKGLLYIEKLISNFLTIHRQESEMLEVKFKVPESEVPIFLKVLFELESLVMSTVTVSERESDQESKSYFRSIVVTARNTHAVELLYASATEGMLRDSSYLVGYDESL
jgi:hypothetical protein